MKSRGILLSLSLIVLSLLLVGCYSSSQSTSRTPSYPTSSPATTAPQAENSSTQSQTHTVTIENFAFSPGTLNINQGDTVTWVNHDNMAHTATGTSFDSKTLQPGQSYSYTFTAAGSYDYKCTFHPSMLGQVNVK